MASVIEAIGIKRKMYFEFENAPYHCLDVEVSKPTARGGQTLVRVKMRNLLTRAVFEKTFKAGEKFGEPDLVQVSATFLYSDGDGFHFMDQETFDERSVPRQILGEAVDYLKDGMELELNYYGEEPIGVELPINIEVQVTQTDPGFRGDTATGGTKPATTETGKVVQVPLFVNTGDRIRVHTRDGSYIERV